MVLLKGVDEAGLSLLHQLRLSEGGAARPRPAGGAGRLLARARPPGALQGTVARLDKAESDAYFAAWACGIRRSAPGRRPSPSRSAHAELDRLVGEAEALRGRRGSAPGALGRLPAAPADGRVLAGAGRAPARPVSLAARASCGRSSAWRPRSRRGAGSATAHLACELEQLLDALG